MKTPRTRSAFTLVELLTVLAVVGILLAILIPVIVSSRRSGAKSACLSNIRQVGAAVLQYAQDYDGVFPPTSHKAKRLTATQPDRDTVWQGEGATWSEMIVPYVGKSFPYCPSRVVPNWWPPSVNYTGYAMNNALQDMTELSKDTVENVGRHEASVQISSYTVLLCEASIIVAGTDKPDTATNVIEEGDAEGTTDKITLSPGALRHNGGANYAFVDGHAKWFRPDAFADPCDGVKPCFRKP